MPGRLRARQVVTVLDERDSDWCTCFHLDTQHDDLTGPCEAEDSYGLPCQCPSFEHDPNTEFDDDGREEC